MTRIALRGLLVLLLLLAPFGAAAQVPSLCPGGSADFDGDGFSDAQECAGVALLAGLRLAANAGTTVPNCAVSGAPRSLCVDPATRDLFVIDQTAQLPLPADALAVFARLGITLHKLLRTVAGTDRTVSAISPQKAIQLATNPDSHERRARACQLGNAQQPGRDHGLPESRRRLRERALPGGQDLPDPHRASPQTSRRRSRPLLTRWVADHEAGPHARAVQDLRYDRYGGYHEAAGSLTVMEQEPKVVDKRGTVTFYIARRVLVGECRRRQARGPAVELVEVPMRRSSLAIVVAGLAALRRLGSLGAVLRRSGRARPRSGASTSPLAAGRR